MKGRGTRDPWAWVAVAGLGVVPLAAVLTAAVYCMFAICGGCR